MLLESTLGVAAVGGGALFAALKTGVSTLDRLGCRGLVAVYLPVIFWQELRHGPAHMVKLGRAYMSILGNESRGDPRFTLGDTSIAAGPSVGITQVLRRTAKELGLFTDPTPATDGDLEEREAYAALADRDGWSVMAGVAVFAEKLRIVRETRPDAGWSEIWSAVRRYNGSGPNAEAYRQKAADFHRRIWGQVQ